MDSFQTTWAPLLYLVAGILFILALRGLSSPATSRAGNRNGMIGMAMGQNNPVQVAHTGAQHLFAKIRRRVDQQFLAVAFDQQGRARAPIFGIFGVTIAPPTFD